MHSHSNHSHHSRQGKISAKAADDNTTPKTMPAVAAAPIPPPPPLQQRSLRTPLSPLFMSGTILTPPFRHRPPVTAAVATSITMNSNHALSPPPLAAASSTRFAPFNNTFAAAVTPPFSFGLDDGSNHSNAWMHPLNVNNNNGILPLMPLLADDLLLDINIDDNNNVMKDSENGYSGSTHPNLEEISQPNPKIDGHEHQQKPRQPRRPRLTLRRRHRKQQQPTNNGHTQSNINPHYPEYLSTDDDDDSDDDTSDSEFDMEVAAFCGTHPVPNHRRSTQNTIHATSTSANEGRLPTISPFHVRATTSPSPTPQGLSSFGPPALTARSQSLAVVPRPHIPSMLTTTRSVSLDESRLLALCDPVDTTPPASTGMDNSSVTSPVSLVCQDDNPRENRSMITTATGSAGAIPMVFPRTLPSTV